MLWCLHHLSSQELQVLELWKQARSGGAELCKGHVDCLDDTGQISLLMGSHQALRVYAVAPPSTPCHTESACVQYIWEVFIEEL